MNEKVIEKIADELGMAVGTAGDFIADMLPQYASLMVMDNMFFVVGALVLCIAAIVAIVVCVVGIRKKEASRDYCGEEAYLAVFLVAILVLFFAGFVLFTEAKALVGWYMFPEAMLLDMAMEAVAC